MPNSPVVLLDDGEPVLENSSGSKFNGFIVAKSYMRLKTEKDFDAENINGYYTKTGTTFQRNEAVANPYYGTKHGNDELGYNTRDNGEPETIRWTYTKIVNPDNGIPMYVDDYGNVQYVPLETPPTNFGTYSTFGRTDFSTHNYTIAQTSKYNLFVSKN